MTDLTVANTRVIVTPDDTGRAIVQAGAVGIQGPAGGTAGSISYNDLTDVPTEFPPAAHTQPSTSISDSTPAGRAMLTAASAAAQAALLGILLKGQATVTVPVGSRDWQETLAAPGVVPGRAVIAAFAPMADTQENHPEFLAGTVIAATAGTDTITFNLVFTEPQAGPIPLNWSAF